MAKPLVIFDLDGTLFQTHEITVAGVQDALANLGEPPPTEEDIRAHFGEPMDEFCHNLLPESGEAEREKLAELIGAYERAEIPARGRSFPGIPEALSELRLMGYTLAVCSNGGEGYIRLVLDSCGIAAFVDRVKGRRAGIRATSKSR